MSTIVTLATFFCFPNHWETWVSFSVMFLFIDLEGVISKLFLQVYCFSDLISLGQGLKIVVDGLLHKLRAYGVT